MTLMSGKMHKQKKNNNIKANSLKDNMGNKSSKSNRSDIKTIKTTELVYSDGTYVGEFYNSLPHGLGKYYYNTGELYIGNFEQGNCSGYGSHYNTLGHLQYCGEWKDNTYHGVGSYYENGQLWYWGEWKLGEAKGYGILYDQYGTPTECHIPVLLPEDPTPQPPTPYLSSQPQPLPSAPSKQQIYPYKGYLSNNDDVCISVNQ